MKKYESVYQQIKENILKGYLKQGDRLDSIRQSCKKYNLSKTTIEAAYNKLVEDGYIISKEKLAIWFVLRTIKLHYIKVYKNIKLFKSQ